MHNERFDVNQLCNGGVDVKNHCRMNKLMQKLMQNGVGVKTVVEWSSWCKNYGKKTNYQIGNQHYSAKYEKLDNYSAKYKYKYE